jgi:4a-hydroxytetrahydrobiopterin dehydratase
MPALSQEDANRHLSALPEWKIEGGELVKNLQFKDFRAALSFVNQRRRAGRRGRPPSGYRHPLQPGEAGLVTHDAGGITAKDFDLAARAEKLL